MASSSGEMTASTNAGGGGGLTPYTPAGRWFFSKDQLLDTPSVRAGLPIAKEISYRQQAANFIQDMGQHLRVTQLCINTAIVYTYRFFMFHSYQRFHRNSIALAALFLAAKVEEQPRKLEHVIKMAHICLNGREAQPLDTRSESYHEKAQELVTNENTLLQTLGFDVAIDHPHTHVVRCCQLVKASKELAQASYYLATNSLHLTTMCLRYSPTIVACFCIHLACKWSNYKIPLSAQNKEWFVYVDPVATNAILEELTEEFLTIYDQCPSRLKKKIEASTQAAREGEEHKQSVSTSMIIQHANVPHPPAVSAPLVVIPHSSSTSRGHPQQQLHAHPHQNADVDHQRRVSSHGVRPPSQPHGATIPAKLPQGPSSIFDAVTVRPSSHGEKVQHPGSIGKRPSGQCDYKVPQLPNQQQHHHQRPQQQLPPHPGHQQPPQQQQQHHQSQRHHAAQQLQQQGVAVSSSRSSSSSSHHPGAPMPHPPQSAPGVAVPPHHSSSHGRSSKAPVPGVPSSAAGRPVIPPVPHQQHKPSSERPQPSPNLSSRDSIGSAKINSVPPLQQQQHQPSRPESPQSLSLSATAKSIFDVDSPVKSYNNEVPAIEKRSRSTVPVDNSIFSIPSTNPTTVMTSHNVQVKQEVKQIGQESILLPPPSAGGHLPKVSKRPSLFSPPSDSESEPDPDVFLPSAFGSSTAPSYPAVKAVKTETVMPEFNQVRLEPIKFELKTELVPPEGLQMRLPLPDQQHHSSSAVGEDNGRKEKKHKEKKKKKDKSKEEDRDREDSGKHHHETTNGESSSSSKKHKHKHKEKSKNRDSDRESGSKGAPPPLPAIKLKIKALPPAAPPATTQPSVAPIKISLAQYNGESGDSHLRKRPREELEGSSGIGPASKMSRVLGTSVESESKFLHVVGGNNAVVPNHLPPKSTKKVSSR